MNDDPTAVASAAEPSAESGGESAATAVAAGKTIDRFGAAMLFALLAGVLVLVGATLSYESFRGHLVRNRYPAFADALARTRANPAIHAGVLWNVDGGDEFRDAGRSLCRDAGGRPSEPVSAQTLTYYQNGYDDLGINPPPAGERPMRVVVPMPWAEYAVVACKQATRTVYFLLGRDLYSESRMGVAAYGGQWGWDEAETPATPEETLTASRLAAALAAADSEDSRGKKTAVRVDLGLPARLTPAGG